MCVGDQRGWKMTSEMSSRRTNGSRFPLWIVSAICAAAYCLCFFLPWLDCSYKGSTDYIIDAQRVISGSVSGYDLASGYTLTKVDTARNPMNHRDQGSETILVKYSSNNIVWVVLILGCCCVLLSLLQGVSSNRLFPTLCGIIAAILLLGVLYLNQYSTSLEIRHDNMLSRENWNNIVADASLSYGAYFGILANISIFALNGLLLLSGRRRRQHDTCTVTNTSNHTMPASWTPFKGLTSGLYLLVVFCFIMPFFNIKCGNADVMTISGTQLLLGADYQESGGMFTRGQTRHIPPDTSAVLAFIFIILGAVLVWLPRKIGNITSLLTGLLAVIMLFALKLVNNNAISSQGQGMLTLQALAGYYCTVAGVVAACIANIVQLIFSGAISRYEVERASNSHTSDHGRSQEDDAIFNSRHSEYSQTYTGTATVADRFSNIMYQIDPNGKLAVQAKHLWQSYVFRFGRLASSPATFFVELGSPSFLGDAVRFAVVTVAITIFIAMFFMPLYVSGSSHFVSYITLLIMQIIGFAMLWGASIIFSLILSAAQNKSLSLTAMMSIACYATLACPLAALHPLLWLIAGAAGVVITVLAFRSMNSATVHASVSSSAVPVMTEAVPSSADSHQSDASGVGHAEAHLQQPQPTTSIITADAPAGSTITVESATPAFAPVSITDQSPLPQIIDPRQLIFDNHLTDLALAYLSWAREQTDDKARIFGEKMAIVGNDELAYDPVEVERSIHSDSNTSPLILLGILLFCHTKIRPFDNYNDLAGRLVSRISNTSKP